MSVNLKRRALFDIDEIERLKADKAALTAMVRELADHLEAETEARYPPESRQYPSEARRYQRDMAPVRRARALIGEDGKHG